MSTRPSGNGTAGSSLAGCERLGDRLSHALGPGDRREKELDLQSQRERHINECGLELIQP